MTQKDLVQYFIVNKELNMSPGKIAAQVAHAATISTLDILSPSSRFASHKEDFIQWYQTGMKKVILKGRQKDLEKLEKLEYYGIRDSGRTEIASGSLTVIVLPPMPKSLGKEIVGYLALF